MNDMDVEEIGGALFRKGQLIRDAWWASWRAGVEQVMAQLRAGERFAGEFAHLLPEPPAVHQVQPPPQPPPPPDYDEQIRRWEEATGKKWQG